MPEQTEQKQTLGTFNMQSRFVRTLLVIVAAALIFVGPTYGTYVFMQVLDLSYAISTIAGIVLLIVGLVLIWFLIRRKVIS
jgi:cytochrome c biogenesis protein CcdA